jgi:hypothetical protein
MQQSSLVNFSGSVCPLWLVGNKFVAAVMRARVCMSWASSCMTWVVNALRSAMVVSHSTVRSSFLVTSMANWSVRVLLECSVWAKLIALSSLERSVAWSRASAEAAVRASTARAWSEMILTIMGDGIAVVGADSDMAASSVENYDSMQHSVMDEQGTEAESRELIAGIDRNLGVGVGVEKTVTRWRGKA